MNDIRQKAEFFAKLTNIENLDKLESVEREQLMVDAVRAGFILSSLFRGWKGTPYAWDMIVEIHPLARKFINAFVNMEKHVDVRELQNKPPSEMWSFDKTTRSVEEHPVATTTMFEALREVIRIKP